MKSKGKGSSEVESNHTIKEVFLEATDGLLTSVAEVVLAELFFGLSLLVSGSYSGSVYRASKAVDEIFDGIETSTVKSACYQLKSRGFITYAKGKNTVVNARLTKEGLERIKDALPQYRKERPWDGKLYFITYDIPESRRRDRDLLRQILKRLGCGLLQQSVWITPYNPKGVLEEAVKEHRIVGDIIVSDTGKEGNIGKTNFKELMERIYDLKKINDRYAGYIETCRDGGFKTRDQAIFKFLSIVVDDPQLPYELLPNDWLGGEACLLFEKFV